MITENLRRRFLDFFKNEQPNTQIPNLKTNLNTQISNPKLNSNSDPKENLVLDFKSNKLRNSCYPEYNENHESRNSIQYDETDKSFDISFQGLSSINLSSYSPRFNNN